MSKQTTRLRDLLVELIPQLSDPSTLLGDRDWIVNGERGILHARENCTSFRQRLTTQAVKLTIAEALERKLCEACGAANLPRREAAAMLGVSRARARLSDIERKLGADEVLPVDLRESLGSLATVATWSDAQNADLLPGPYEAMLEHAHRLGDLAEDARARSLEPALRRIARRVMLVTAPARAGVYVAENGSADEFARINRLLGSHGRRSFLTHYYESWMDARVEGTPRDHRDSTSRPELRDFEQLDGITVGKVDPRADLGTLMAERWSREVDEILAAATAEWDEHFDVLMSRREPVLVACSSSYGWGLRDEERTLLSALGLDNESGVPALAVVPELAAGWLCAELNGRIGIVVERAEHLPTRETIETAAALWSPHDGNSSYRHLQDTLDAAEAL